MRRIIFILLCFLFTFKLNAYDLRVPGGIASESDPIFVSSAPLTYPLKTDLTTEINSRISGDNALGVSTGTINSDLQTAKTNILNSTNTLNSKFSNYGALAGTQTFTGGNTFNKVLKHQFGIISDGTGQSGSVIGNARGLGAIDLQTFRDSPDRIAAGNYSIISGGAQNTIKYINATYSGEYSTISGGYDNYISGRTYATICGGANNISDGHYSIVCGGRGNIADGEYSFVAGRRAVALGVGSFSLGDSTDADFVVNIDNTFGARFAGGYWLTGGNVGIGTTAPTHTLEVNGQVKASTVTALGFIYSGTSLPTSGYPAKTMWIDDSFDIYVSTEAVVGIESWVKKNP